MTTEITNSKVALQGLQDTQTLCAKLMETPHYRKMGMEGMYAIVEKARSIGINPTDALNGGMFFVQGKVELSSAMMNQLIRSHKHSITKDKRSNEETCILHGKRADNGDTWMESFSIKDAQLAGIYRGQWLKYPRDMMFARALSRLARQLFPDVIKGCYIQGEISVESAEVIELPSNEITEKEANALDIWIGDDNKYRTCVMNFIKTQFGAENLSDMPRETYDKILPVAKRKNEERNKIVEIALGEESQIALEG
jgi:hypothetical protein